MTYTKKQLQIAYSDFVNYIDMLGGENKCPLRLLIARDSIKEKIERISKE